MTNQEIATLISERIGDSPIPFESVRALAIQIYEQLGGTEDDENFKDIYEILLAIIPIAHSGSQIDDNNVSTGTTWSSSKINTELNTKSNKIDTSIFMDANTEQIDYSNLNSFTEAGKYIVSLNLVFGQQVFNNFGIASLSVNNFGNIIQTLHIEFSGVEIAVVRTSVDGGQTWIEQVTVDDNILSAYINDNDAGNNMLPYTYSADKIKQLLRTYVTKNDASIYATIDNVNSSLANKANTSYVDNNFVKLSILTQSQYNDLCSNGTVNTSTLYLTTDSFNAYNRNYAYLGTSLIGETIPIDMSSASKFEYMSIDSGLIWPTTPSALPAIIRNTYKSVYEYGLMEFSQLQPRINKIGESAFYGNNKLSAIIIPVSINRIYSNAFSNCSSLTNFIYDGTMNEWASVTKDANWINNTPATVVHCSDGDAPI